jgi:transcriptional regulator with XRE-family HTH domain
MGVKSVFGANVRFYRKQKGLSQEKLSESLDITNKHLSAIETGGCFVSAELLEKLTLCLGVSASVLFYTPEEKSGDDSFLSTIDRIVEEESMKAVLAIKARLRGREA